MPRILAHLLILPSFRVLHDRRKKVLPRVFAKRAVGHVRFDGSQVIVMNVEISLQESEVFLDLLLERLSVREGNPKIAFLPQEISPVLFRALVNHFSPETRLSATVLVIGVERVVPHYEFVIDLGDVLHDGHVERRAQILELNRKKRVYFCQFVFWALLLVPPVSLEIQTNKVKLVLFNSLNREHIVIRVVHELFRRVVVERLLR